MKTMLLLLPFLFLVACAKPDSTNLEDKRNRELEVENENSKRKAMQLEEDLSRKQRHFSALKGVYEGTLIADDKKEFKTEIILVPSLPPYEAGRVRTIEELATDLNNLYFTVQIAITNKQTETTTMNCLFTQVKADYDGGRMNVASEGCYGLFFINLYSSTNARSSLQLEKPTVAEKSQNIAQKILSKEISRVDELFVEMVSTQAKKSFLMILKRTQP